MSQFQIHTPDTATAESAEMMQESIKAFGMVPNLHAVMAESPELFEGYRVLHALAQKTSFNADELTVVWQTINVEHNCHYCVPAHTAIAKSMKVGDDVIDALRNETPLPNAKLEVLRNTTLAIVRERAVVGGDVLDPFFSAGFTNQNLLEIILVLSQKVMSNYVNHLADTPVDEPFQKFDWTKKA